MNPIEIQSASDADAATIVKILHEAFREYDGVLNPPSGVRNESADTVRAKMQTGQWLLAYSDGRAVGCVWCEPRDGFMYLGRLAVLPAQRGRGIGNALIDSVEARAKNAGFTRVRLGVRTALHEMRAAYERRGYVFVETHTHEGFTAPTYVILEKTL
jgi:ribosomal protein S18 acetylase RimI-like enzyme